jgi:hypothetical protein
MNTEYKTRGIAAIARDRAESKLQNLTTDDTDWLRIAGIAAITQNPKIRTFANNELSIHCLLNSAPRR